MKLNVQFETMKLDDEIIAIPLSDNFKGILKLDDFSKEILDVVSICDKPIDVVKKMIQRYPNEDPIGLSKQISDFILTLAKEGIVDIHDDI